MWRACFKPCSISMCSDDSVPERGAFDQSGVAEWNSIAKAFTWTLADRAIMPAYATSGGGRRVPY